MLIRHLLVGVVMGALAALGSALVGASGWVMLGGYVSGGILGIGLSAFTPVPRRQSAATSTAVMDQPRLSAKDFPLAEWVVGAGTGARERRDMAASQGHDPSAS